MAYYSGTANSVAELLTAIRTSAVTDGWTLAGSVLSKGTMHVEHTISQQGGVDRNIRIRGGTDASMASPSPYESIGRMLNVSHSIDLAFPCFWEFHGHPQECYFVVRYSVDRYQWMAWGKSTVPGLTGVGTWVAASLGRPIWELTSSPESYMPIRLTTDIYGSVLGGGSVGGHHRRAAWAMWADNEAIGVQSNAGIGYCHHGLDSAQNNGWSLSITNSTSYRTIGHDYLGALLAREQPSAWSSEAVLLPLQAYMRRSVNTTLSLIVDHEHARLVRIDNLTPDDVLTLGPDKWKVYPWHRKDIVNRNGTSGGDHTGTFGWAVRYLGP